MSNRTYLQFKQYKDDEEMNRIHKLAFNKMKDYVDDDLFDDWEWRDECIHFNKTIEIYSSELTENLIKNNPNFIPNEVIDKYLSLKKIFFSLFRTATKKSLIFIRTC